MQSNIKKIFYQLIAKLRRNNFIILSIPVYFIGGYYRDIDKYLS